MTLPRIAIVASHPIQYHAPWFRELARISALRVLFAHRQSPQQQAAAGYGVAFDWDVDVLSGYESEFLVNVSSAPGVDTHAGCDTPAVGERILAHRADAVVVLGWNLRCFWQAARAARRAGIRTLVRGDSQLRTPRPLWLRAAKRVVYPIRLRAFDHFLPVGIRSREYLQHYGVSPERCTICPHTIDVVRFRGEAERAVQLGPQLRAEHGIPAGNRVAMFVGRLLDWKRPDDLVRAAAASQRRTETTCVFVGAGESRQGLAGLARELGVHAVFAGFRNQGELPAWYALADMLVLPSTGRETWGLVVNEALASGTRVIASDAVGCAPDFSAYPECFATYPCGDVATLAERLDHIERRAERARDDIFAAAVARFAPDVAARALVSAVAGA